MSFLRWAGSKKQIRETLSHCWHAAQNSGGSGRYVEAFCGSASFYFYIKPSAAILIDINADLIDCLDAIKTNSLDVAEVVHKYPTTKEFYYELRKANLTNLNKVEAAARFLYLNRYCFNGLYRTNTNGIFNVPYGGNRTGSLPSADTLKAASLSLQTSELIHGDFEFAISGRINKGDFLYLDPPYALRNRTLDFQYGPDVFGLEDLDRLFNLLIEIDRIGAFFVFSYADCDEVKDFSLKWNHCFVEVQRSIAADVARRGRVREILISNI
jgi:DNA adenine methylase